MTAAPALAVALGEELAALRTPTLPARGARAGARSAPRLPRRRAGRRARRVDASPCARDCAGSAAPAMRRCSASRERLPAPQAAIANGAAAHALEMDDTHQGGSIHLGASVFSGRARRRRARRRERRRRAARRRRRLRGGRRGSRWPLDPAAHYAPRLPPDGNLRRVRRRGGGRPRLRPRRRRTRARARHRRQPGRRARWSSSPTAPGPSASIPAGRRRPGCTPRRSRARASARRPRILEGRFGFLHAYSGRRSTRRAPRPTHGFELMRRASSRMRAAATCRRRSTPRWPCGRRTASTPAAVDRIEVGIVARRLPDRLRADRRRSAGRARWSTQQFSLPFGVAVALVRGAASPGEFVLETARRSRGASRSWIASSRCATRRSTRTTRACGRRGSASRCAMVARWRSG